MLLTWLWLLPALGALAAWAAPSRAARGVGIAWSAAVLAYSLWLLLPFSSGTGPLRLEELSGLSFHGIRYRLGVDGVSLSLCWLTALLTTLSLAASGVREERPPAYWAAFLALEASLMGVFTSQNLFYFYVFWDLSLIPMFFIIGLWGSQGRRFASIKFLLYTFAGSLALLIGIVWLAVLHESATGAWTWDIPALARTPVSGCAAGWIFALIALGFSVKIPLWPLHNWLPDAHTEAPAAGSVLLAGAMLKMGVYGFLKVLLPVFPVLAREALPWMGLLGVVNILYGAVCAMAQTDLKRLIAFTSISHLGFCVVGIFSGRPEGLAGAALQMLNHGLSTGGLFLLVGMLYERAHRRDIGDFGELARTAPWFAFFFGFVLLSSIGLPGLNGFVGELLALMGMAKASPPLAALGAAGAVLAAAYAIPTYQKVFWAPAGPGSVSGKISDMDRRERGILWVLAALILWIGIYPGPLLGILEPGVSALVLR
ncbi:MAG: NADH-quinone oxidoreductase subunit M [Elusimicrobia bacterium]|nr:NADH-quinone oxidoreductase subunit M [Elusimicrobiota bacterium]